MYVYLCVDTVSIYYIYIHCGEQSFCYCSLGDTHYFTVTQRSALSHSEVHCHTAKCTATQRSALSHSEVHCHTAKCTVTQRSALSHSEVHCHTAKCTVTQRSALSYSEVHCHTAKCTVTQRSALSHSKVGNFQVVFGSSQLTVPYRISSNRLRKHVCVA